MEMLLLCSTVDLKMIPLNVQKWPLCSIFSLCYTIHYKFVHGTTCFAQFLYCLFFLLLLSSVNFFLFSLKWIPISIIINVTIVICKTNHSLLVKILKIHYNMLCVHHHPLLVKILKIHHSMLCIHHPPHMWYMHPSSNVKLPTSGSSQNPQIYS